MGKGRKVKSRMQSGAATEGDVRGRFTKKIMLLSFTLLVKMVLLVSCAHKILASALHTGFSLALFTCFTEDHAHESSDCFRLTSAAHVEEDR